MKKRKLQMAFLQFCCSLNVLPYVLTAFVLNKLFKFLVLRLDEVRKNTFKE